MATPPFTLPGFIEPLSFIHSPERDEYGVGVIPASGSGNAMFPNALYEPDIKYGADPQSRVRLNLTTLREFAMMRFMNEITDKPQWNVKIMDDAIADKWKTEAQQQDDFSERMATYCIEELRWRVKEFEKTGFVFVFNGDVVKSDSAVSDKLKAKLQAAVAKLEAVESQHKDYHPHSDDKVWDLVHPSLFPLVFGTSRILRDDVIGLDDCMDKIGLGEIVPVPSSDDALGWEPIRYQDEEHYSRKFQWLPCDVRLTVANDETKPSLTTATVATNTEGEHVDDEGVKVGIKCSITSYINNLHPYRHGDLYKVLEEIIAAAIPLWSETLLANEDRSRPLRIPYTQVEYEGDPDNSAYSLWDGDVYKTHRQALHAVRIKCIVYPEPDPFQAPCETECHGASACSGTTTHSFMERFAADGLQVIVKLATIELTPEKPSYDGGVWHVEGQLNEHICATALYYYSCDNITESRLGFRHLCEAGHLYSRVNYTQSDDTFLGSIFGRENGDPGVQDVGSVVCQEGRLITFPNNLLHQVLPFQLADPTKPGHRKILALFLVDPNLHIISTSSVPPQRLDWWREQVFTGESRLASLNSELQDKILAYLDFPPTTVCANDVIATMLHFPLGIEHAKMLRLELMEERKEFKRFQTDGQERVTFSLCEH